MKKYNIFLDDIRNPVDFYPENSEYWTVCRDMESFKNLITSTGIPSRIAFDNDLGQGIGKDGFDCMKWYIEIFGGEFNMVDIHTDNLPAAEQMISYVNTWFKIFKPNECPSIVHIPGSKRLKAHGKDIL